MKKLLLVLVANMALNAQNINFSNNWSLLGATENINTSDFKFSECIDYLWSYDSNNSSWRLYVPNNTNIEIPNSIDELTLINKGEGFWIKGNSECDTSITYTLEDITLKGRTINQDGNQETITIEAKNIIQNNYFSFYESDLTIVDENGYEINKSSNKHILWGYWNNEPSKKWIAGQKTDTNIIDSIVNDTEQTTKITYSGKVYGINNDNEEIDMNNSNNIQINFKLGAGQNAINSSIEFQIEDATWNAQWSGSVTNNTFSSLTFEGEGNSQALMAAGLDGLILGNNMEYIGGTFILMTQNGSVTAVFKASKD